jgi:hypothetical protein
MIPALLYLLFKKLKSHHWQIKKVNLYSWLFLRSSQMIFTFIVILLLLSIVLSAQKQTRNYKIMRKGSEVGWVHVERQTDSNTTTITMGTEVKIRFIFTYESAAREVSQFRDGKLQHSYYYRKTNGNVKADRHTYLVGNSYEVGESQKVKLNISPVAYNTLCMYFQEPVNVNKVYSDNHQCCLDIIKESDGGYSFTSSDGTTNTFYYRGGICYKVKLDHSFYSAVLLLK